MNTEQNFFKKTYSWEEAHTLKEQINELQIENAHLIAESERAQQNRENPKPLTVEELKERDGKPVYCVDGAGNKAWAVVNASAEDCIDNESGAWIFSYYALPGTDGLHGLNKQLGWLAYDHEPKEDK